MPLTDIQVRNAKPAERDYKLADERGLYVLVKPTGRKWWRWKYRHEGKEKLLSFGVYPAVPLREARARRDEARKLLATGTDPSAHRQAQKAAHADRAHNSFEVLAREWLAAAPAASSWARTTG